MKSINTILTTPLKTCMALLLVAILAFSCEKEVITPADQNTPRIELSEHEQLKRPDAQCGSSQFEDLRNHADQLVGSVEILNDETQLYILIDMEFGQHLDHVKAFLGSAAGIEVYGDGDLNMEEFQFQNLMNGAHRYTIQLPLGSLSGSQDLVLFTQVSQRDFFGNVTSTSDAYLDGLTIGNGEYVKYSIGTCGAFSGGSFSAN